MARVKLEDIVNIDYGAVEAYLSSFLRGELESSGRKGYIVGLSGGLDSSVTYALAVRALGAGSVFPIIMPDPSVTPQADVDDAIGLARLYGTRYHVVNIAPIIDVFRGSLPIYESEEADRMALGNLRARVRMCILYYYANKLDYLVLGTGDRSEILIGYFTKYGDGGVDVAPLAVLYKSQVRRLALHLGVPESIAFKPSSPRLWPGHEAEKELGVSYGEVDLVLHAFLDLKLGRGEISGATGVSEGVVERVLDMYERSKHKRAWVKAPSVEPIVEMMVKLGSRN